MNLKELKYPLCYVRGSRKVRFQSKWTLAEWLFIGRKTIEGARAPKGSSSRRKRRVVSQEAIKKKHSKTTHSREWQNWHRRTKFQSPLYSGRSKNERIQGGQKMRGKVWDSVEWSNDSGPSGEKSSFVEWPEESMESNPHFSDKKTFTVDLVFNEQNDWVVTFGNDASQYRRVSTTKYPGLAMMLGVVTSSILVWSGLQVNLCHL